MSSSQYVVVGAGLAGAATAWSLTRRGHEVTLVERTQPAARDGSSHGSARIFRYAYSDPFEDPGEGVGVAQRSEIQRTGRGDQPPTADPFQLVEARLGRHDEPDVEGVGVGVAEDAGRSVGAAVAARGLRPLQNRHLVSAPGEAPCGGRAGETGADDNVS